MYELLFFKTLTGISPSLRGPYFKDIFRLFAFLKILNMSNTDVPRPCPKFSILLIRKFHSHGHNP